VTGPGRVGVVLAGAGARGAYEAGVLSVVLPHLERNGVRPDLYLGTSAGAINACLFTAHAHLPAEQQAKAVLEVWRGIGLADVFRPLAMTAPWALTRWTAQRLGIPGARLTALLDTSPLRRTADRLVDWDQLRANLDEGRPATLAVTATLADGCRTTVFVDRPTAAGPVPAEDPRPIDYVPTAISAAHVLASAAIPVAFPPVRVDAPAAAAGWYLDGGVRLNVPLKPALALGADAVVVIATHPETEKAPDRPRDAAAPDIDDAVAQLMDVALVDPMVDDLRTLRKINAAAKAGGTGMSVVPFLFFGPADRGALGHLAATAYRQRYGGLAGSVRSLRGADLPVLAWLLGGDGNRRGDALSYLLFDPEFTERAIALGQADATAVLATGGAATTPWVT
jgi:NTE family protein